MVRCVVMEGREKMIEIVAVDSDKERQGRAGQGRIGWTPIIIPMVIIIIPMVIIIIPMV